MLLEEGEEEEEGWWGPRSSCGCVSTPRPWRSALLSWFGLPLVRDTEAATSCPTAPTDTLEHTRKEHTLKQTNTKHT